MILPSPSNVDVQVAPQVQIENGTVVHHRQRDTFTPTTYSVAWSSIGPAGKSAIEQHWRANFHQRFEWTPPKQDDAVEVMYLGSPRSRRTGNRWNVTATFQTQP